MLMGIVNLEVEIVNSDEKEDEVDLQGELISALEETKRLTKKNKT